MAARTASRVRAWRNSNPSPKATTSSRSTASASASVTTGGALPLAADNNSQSKCRPITAADSRTVRCSGDSSASRWRTDSAIVSGRPREASRSSIRSGTPSAVCSTHARCSGEASTPHALTMAAASSRSSGRSSTWTIPGRPRWRRAKSSAADGSERSDTTHRTRSPPRLSPRYSRSETVSGSAQWRSSSTTSSPVGDTRRSSCTTASPRKAPDIAAEALVAPSATGITPGSNAVRAGSQGFIPASDGRS